MEGKKIKKQRKEKTEKEMIKEISSWEKIYIGIDNGTTGAIGIIDGANVSMVRMPIKAEQSYTKTRQSITRVDYQEFYKIISEYENKTVLAIIERPMVNPLRFKASASALRCLEATLICLEQFKIPIMYCDSKEWQKVLLPHLIPIKKKGKKLNIREKVAKKKKEERKTQLKKDSLDIAQRLFPKIDYTGFKDGDSLLIAEWARRMNF